MVILGERETKLERTGIIGEVEAAVARVKNTGMDNSSTVVSVMLVVGQPPTIARLTLTSRLATTPIVQ